MNLSTKITAFLIEQNIVSKKNKEVYEYGFDLLIADFINFSTILLIGVLCCRPWPTVLYLTIFVGLRSVCGGYHAKTHLKCHVCTIGVYIGFLVLLHTLGDQGIMLLWGDCIAAIPIILFAPITHANKSLPPKIYNRNRITSIILTLGLIASAFLLDYYNHIESTIISLTLWIVSLCMIPAIDIHSSNLRRKKHEKNYLSGMH